MIEKIVSSILKDIKQGDVPTFDENAGYNADDYNEAIKYILDHQLASNILYTNDKASIYNQAKLTERGNEFLEQH
ncbi:hypothetical protein UY416_09700 [Paenibacillus polymyxa]|uniref:hypothetical protein n=1 Tax=Paenibacillus polymyxa TaxID=1406 RepID=UPI000FA8297F|nr:hypothetical protein [Paenibacillus polymyxa]MDY8046567.1 hypothetical protein [Paenibacillus polymyxa]